MTDGRAKARLQVLALLVVLMFSALTVRLWYLQVLATDEFKAEAEGNYVRLVETPTIRGQIFTADGQPIVENRPSLEIRVQRDRLGDDAEAVTSRLTKLLGLPPATIRKAMNDVRYYDYQPVPVAIDVPKRAVAYIGEHRRLFPGVTWEDVAVRKYPLGELAAHVLGWTSPVFAEDLERLRGKGYDPNDVIGRGGLEQQYERWLRGQEGFVKYEVNAAGEQMGVLGEKQPVPGDDLVISIDSELQAAAEESLDLGMEEARNVVDENGRYLRADAGAVVVMNPETGAIEATVSRPSFDPDEFVGGIDQERFDRLVDEDRGAPLFNRVTQGQYAPGSTFKPFIALSALRNGVASTGQYYPCPASYRVPEDTSGTVFHNWSSVTQGPYDIAGSLAQSCDTIYYDWGYKFYQRYYPTKDAKDPSEPLQRDLRQFGFERSTGVDLPTESVGNIPDDAWVQDLFDAREAFSDFMIPGEFIQMSIGQGGVLATPLQTATAYSMIANGGKCVVPHLGLEVRDQSTQAGKVVKPINPKCSRDLPYSHSELEYVKQGLVDVIRSGTAAQTFAGFGGSIAGKTGTSQKEKEQDFSWFAAMTPVADPQHVIVAVVEHGGHGSETAAPIVRRVVEHIDGVDASDIVIGSATD
ncbi:MAG: penicillin-binding protein 2 [Actinomycetota bacterium]